MNEILQFLAKVLQKSLPVEFKEINKQKLNELETSYGKALGEIHFEVKKSLVKKDEYVLRYEIEKLK